jgi:alkylhydroperoxidase/carboxymuconolactone decarboxylase family protein YurZ
VTEPTTPAPAAPAAPSPADLANQVQKNTPVELRDPETGVVMTQERFAANMAKERRAGRHAALREIAEAAGVPFDIDAFDPSKFGQMFQEAEKARQARLSEEQKRAEELQRREQELADLLAQAAQREADAKRQARDVQIRAALVTRGATGDDLEDAAALLRLPDDADDTAIAEAADKLKERRAELFGATVAGPQPGQLPPAPGGAPAGGPPPRTAPAGRPGDRGREMARLRGHATDSAA